MTEGGEEICVDTITNMNRAIGRSTATAIIADPASAASAAGAFPSSEEWLQRLQGIRAAAAGGPEERAGADRAPRRAGRPEHRGLGRFLNLVRRPPDQVHDLRPRADRAGSSIGDLRWRPAVVGHDGVGEARAEPPTRARRGVARAPAPESRARSLDSSSAAGASSRTTASSTSFPSAVANRVELLGARHVAGEDEPGDPRPPERRGRSGEVRDQDVVHAHGRPGGRRDPRQPVEVDERVWLTPLVQDSGPSSSITLVLPEPTVPTSRSARCSSLMPRV